MLLVIAVIAAFLVGLCCGWAVCRHKHNWGSARHFYTPAVQPFPKLTNATHENIRDALFGFTLVTQTCKGCNKQRSYKVNGDVRPAARPS